jgi:hypothetical protein
MGKFTTTKIQTKKLKQGSMSLENAKISQDAKYKKNEIMIIHGVEDEFDMHIQAPSEEIAAEWRRAIQSHIKYLYDKANPVRDTTLLTSPLISSLSPPQRRKSQITEGGNVGGEVVTSHPLT